MSTPRPNPTDPFDALAAACGPRGRPDRFHARAVLLWIGERLLAGDGESASRGVARTQAAAAGQARAWVGAVQEELSLACTEHVRSVDPRYLARPDYDLHYVVEARVELQARLEAAEALGIEVPHALIQRVMAADRLLEPLLRARPGNETPSAEARRWPRPDNATS